jgi:hypothetical protein
MKKKEDMNASIEQITYKPAYIPIMCPVCKGHKTVNWGKEVCGVCKGDGFLKVPTEEGEYHGYRK